MIILTKILCSSKSFFVDDVAVEEEDCSFCFLRNGKSILDPKGDFHQKIFNNSNNNTEMMIVLFVCLCFASLFLLYRMNKKWSLFQFSCWESLKFTNLLYIWFNDISKNMKVSRSVVVKIFITHDKLLSHYSTYFYVTLQHSNRIRNAGRDYWCNIRWLA